MPSTAPFAADAEEHLLREDRRLLGRLLGDVVREQAGEAVFETILEKQDGARGTRAASRSLT
jgi:phosphoenolpyruvate carboxylase